MKDNVLEIRRCPRRGMLYHGVPSLSRADNQTFICPDCGTREALQSIGVDSEEQEKILQLIHRRMERPSMDCI